MGYVDEKIIIQNEKIKERKKERKKREGWTCVGENINKMKK